MTEPFHRPQCLIELDQACDRAREALSNLADYAAWLQEQYAAEHNVAPEQVQIMVSERDMTLTPVIRSDT